MSIFLREVVSGFWVGAKKLGRAYSYDDSSFEALSRSSRHNYQESLCDQIGNDAYYALDPIFTQMPHIQPEAARLGNPQPLNDYIASCYDAARQGSVMVSPFISSWEKDILRTLLQEKRPIIYLAENGFKDYYKPSALLFDAVANDRLLILSPWPYDPSHKHVSRADCIICAQ